MVSLEWAQALVKTRQLVKDKRSSLLLPMINEKSFMMLTPVHQNDLLWMSKFVVWGQSNKNFYGRN